MITEPVTATQQLADYQWRPPFGKYLGPERHRAELAIRRVHATSLRPATANNKFKF